MNSKTSTASLKPIKAPLIPSSYCACSRQHQVIRRIIPAPCKVLLSTQVPWSLCVWTSSQQSVAPRVRVWLCPVTPLAPFIGDDDVTHSALVSCWSTALFLLFYAQLYITRPFENRKEHFISNKDITAFFFFFCKGNKS